VGRAGRAAPLRVIARAAQNLRIDVAPTYLALHDAKQHADDRRTFLLRGLAVATSRAKALRKRWTRSSGGVFETEVRRSRARASRAALAAADQLNDVSATEFAAG
jgi:hypothetical protein